MGDYVPMTVMGAYEVFTSDEMMEEIMADGDPRYPVLEYDALLPLLGDDEAMKEGSKLWLRPTRESYMFYVNSSYPNKDATNIERELNNKLSSNPPSSADEAKEMLADATNGISFKIKRAVKAGDELLGWYPIPKDATNGCDEGDETGSGREKRQRTSLRSSVDGGAPVAGVEA